MYQIHFFAAGVQDQWAQGETDVVHFAQGP